MRVACLTVTYPGVEEYLADFIGAFRRQTHGAAELVIMNDGLTDIQELLDHFKLHNVQIEDISGTPAQNRLAGLQLCASRGFDLIVCADADETMAPDRIQNVMEYFQANPDADLVYNNAQYQDSHGRFSLNFKPRLQWQDLLDFNVLGYGAMNLRSGLVDFFVNEADTRAVAFDWWLGMVYLLHHEGVDFLADTYNIYRKHPANFVGPITRIEDETIHQAVQVKAQFYQLLNRYCRIKQLTVAQDVISEYLNRFEATRKQIQTQGFQWYSDSVRTQLNNTKQIYWWQPAIMADELAAVRASA
jgi:glycosyltransferase involved in cell wall biosynthesis